MRIDNRKSDEMRPVRITKDYLLTAEGSVLIEIGNTRVLCTATVEDSIPQFLRNTVLNRGSAEHARVADLNQHGTLGR